jgi:hypothetical protein
LAPLFCLSSFQTSPLTYWSGQVSASSDLLLYLS